MSMLDLALSYIERGWFVFPCWPKTKKPMTPHGFKDASADPVEVVAWWTKTPDANIAIATGPSDLTVLDFDHGFECWADVLAFCVNNKIPLSYTVRTGRRQTYGAQMYFQGSGLESISWKLEDGAAGDIRSATGYVMAAGSVHPDSGELYEVVNARALAPVPEWVRQLAPLKRESTAANTVSDGQADEWKTWLLEYCDHNSVYVRGYEKRVSNGWWLGIDCPWGGEHASGPGAESSTVLGILDGKLAFECSHGTCKAAKRDTAAFKRLVDGGVMTAEPGADPIPVLGKPKDQAEDNGDVPGEAPKDWRERWHSFESMRDAPPVTFVIKGFLEHQGVTALAAPAGQRKSLIALNVAHACCTGEKLFDFFEVATKPNHVLYLCPEMGLSSFSERLKRIGLLEHVGKTLFCRTLNSEGFLGLDDFRNEELNGAVVILDTLVRFVEGDENDVQDMRKFAAKAMALITRGAASVLILHHSGKGTKESPELTLENVLRGSSELGAFVCCCWGTRLQDPTEPYKSNSYLANVKPRDFESEPFEVSSGEDCRLHMVGVPGSVVLKSKFTGNRDDKDTEADDYILKNPQLSARELAEDFKAMGIKRGKSWAAKARTRLLTSEHLKATGN